MPLDLSSPRTSTRFSWRTPVVLISGPLVVVAAAAWFGAATLDTPVTASPPDAVSSVREVGGTVRLTGTVEAVRAFSVKAPRLIGQPSGTSLVVTKLVPGGARVEAGDVLIEFDRQGQERTARDQRSAFLDLEGQIRRLRAEHAAARAADQAELTVATSNVARARLEVTTNSLLPRVEGEKNDLALEEAIARLAQLTHTLTLKRKAAGAELQILEIQRDRALSDASNAERNATNMVVTAPFGGLVVLKPVFRQNGMTEVKESEEVRPGVAILDVVDASAMQVRALANQADIAHVTVGRAVRVRLDAYPDLVFDGRVKQVAPLAVPSGLAPLVRTFATVVSIEGSHERLMPDLSAAVDISSEPPSTVTSERSSRVDDQAGSGAH